MPSVSKDFQPLFSMSLCEIFGLLNMLSDCWGHLNTALNNTSTNTWELVQWTNPVHLHAVLYLTIGTFRSDYDNDYEYEFFNVYPMRLRDCVRLSRQLVLSSKSRRRLDANYEIFNKSRPPTTSSLPVQRRVKGLVLNTKARYIAMHFCASRSNRELRSLRHRTRNY